MDGPLRPRLTEHVTVRLDEEDKAWLEARARKLTSLLAPGSRVIYASDVVRMCVAEKREREREAANDGQ